ncbi:hypothetical protein Enr8_44720 [Blastopirellula retiformator]|uniref:Uncharacterized protein n=1 Tax=Blastopirellula retiformator TaxID=2527970 RepID=A0A5C5UW84_9BACT|nr:hypothetical protein Enr8_44720 [Blastopirellula retiformator]
MRSQNSDVSRYFASREELCSEPGEVGKCHDGIFQQAVRAVFLHLYRSGWLWPRWSALTCIDES